MCERYSWIEYNGATLFLTGEDVYRTKRGRELRRFSACEQDYMGHGAIRFYYGDLKGGIEKECTDFSTPDNFPPELVKAIKLGKMRELGLDMNLAKMLTNKALGKIPSYEKACAAYDKAYAAFDKACAAYDKAWTAYNKICAAYDKACAAFDEAWTAFDKARAAYNKAYAAFDEAWTAFDKARAAYNKAYAAYDKARAAYDKTRAAFDKARAAYDKARAAFDKACAAFDKACDNNCDKFWDLFAVKSNRIKAWR